MVLIHPSLHVFEVPRIFVFCNVIKKLVRASLGQKRLRPVTVIVTYVYARSVASCRDATLLRTDRPWGTHEGAIGHNCPDAGGGNRSAAGTQERSL